MRCEGALLLALSACSPFLDGVATGAHSQRWLQFPLTPEQVPLFSSHQHYIQWVEEQLAAGSMQNVRHLWTSVRPNGDHRPHDLNRLEIRICDLIADPALLLAVTAFAELRIQQLLADPDGHDPLVRSCFSPAELAALADANDRAAARASLEAPLVHWRSGETLTARDWIAAELEQLAPLAAELGLTATLAPLQRVLSEGNQAIQWLRQLEAGEGVAGILTAGIAAMEREEQALIALAATDRQRALG
jgi:predicted glutamate--cysteine ligase